jgi:hypothetical protein
VINHPTQVLDDRLSLEELTALRAVPPRDCRSCPKFEPDPEGRAFGWCAAHLSYVKLYHAESEWHSQCQFKTLRTVRAIRPGDGPNPIPTREAG